MPCKNEPIIISASRRTDIPAFYSEWFMNRVQNGFFVKVNPYNHRQQKQVSLLRDDVAAFVFWTKNPLPLIPSLPLLDTLGYRYLFHFTLNNYPDVWEPRIPPLHERIEIFRRLSEEIGPEKVIWRYDPIIISNCNPVDSHLAQFSQIANLLQGYTRRVIISLVTMYDKVLMNLKRSGIAQSIRLKDLRAQEYQQELCMFMKSLASIAEKNGLTIYTCSEKVDLSSYNIQPGSCIDSQWINQLFKLNLKAAKDRYQRPECHCAPSIDMGFYDTCRFGCLYCYANTNMERVIRNSSLHNPTSPTLLVNT
jgi:DNA repair photolyase